MLKIPIKKISARLASMPFTNRKMCGTKNNFRNKMETVEIISFGGMSSAQKFYMKYITVIILK